VETNRTPKDIEQVRVQLAAAQETATAASQEAERVLQAIDSLQPVGNEDLDKIRLEARRYLVCRQSSIDG
jgi:hypothetical protein